MADSAHPYLNPPPSNTPEPGFPVAAIVCLAIGGYMVVIVTLFLIRGMLMRRGMCHEQCCGKEDSLQCCECCVSCAEGTNCLKSPNIESCLNSVCPARQRLDCIDIIMCECCSQREGGCCPSQEPLCDCDGCTGINCGCFSINFSSNTPGQFAQNKAYQGYPPYPGYEQFPAPGGSYENPVPSVSEGFPGANYPAGVPPRDPSSAHPEAGPRRPLPGGALSVGAPPFSMQMFSAQRAQKLSAGAGTQASAAPF